MSTFYLKEFKCFVIKDSSGKKDLSGVLVNHSKNLLTEAFVQCLAEREDTIIRLLKGETILQICQSGHCKLCRNNFISADAFLNKKSWDNALFSIDYLLSNRRSTPAHKAGSSMHSLQLGFCSDEVQFIKFSWTSNRASNVPAVVPR